MTVFIYILNETKTEITVFGAQSKKDIILSGFKKNSSKTGLMTGKKLGCRCRS